MSPAHHKLPVGHKALGVVLEGAEGQPRVVIEVVVHGG